MGWCAREESHNMEYDSVVAPFCFQCPSYDRFGAHILPQGSTKREAGLLFKPLHHSNYTKVSCSSLNGSFPLIITLKKGYLTKNIFCRLISQYSCLFAPQAAHILPWLSLILCIRIRIVIFISNASYLKPEKENHRVIGWVLFEF